MFVRSSRRRSDPRGQSTSGTNTVGLYDEIQSCAPASVLPALNCTPGIVIVIDWSSRGRCSRGIPSERWEEDRLCPHHQGLILPRRLGSPPDHLPERHHLFFSVTDYDEFVTGLKTHRTDVFENSQPDVLVGTFAHTRLQASLSIGMLLPLCVTYEVTGSVSDGTMEKS